METKTVKEKGITKVKAQKIEKPKKVLREDLQIRKAEHENTGWEFTEHPDQWEAKKDGASFSRETLSDLLDELDGLKAIEEKYSDTKVFATNQNIIKVDSSLIEDNRLWIDSLEVQGWKFDFKPDEYGNIKAEKHFKYEEKPTVFNSWKLNEIVSLLRSITNHQSDMDNMGYANRKDFGKPYVAPEVKKLSATYRRDEFDAFARNLTKNGTRGKHLQLTPVNLSNVAPSPLPSQVRRRARFDQGELDQLALSVKNNGIVNPPTFRPLEGGMFEIVAGERRFLAAERAGLDEIDAIVRTLSDTEAAEIQLTENLRRTDLHPLDRAFSYQDMIERLKCDEKEIALREGETLEHVTNHLALLKLAPEIVELFEKDEITLNHALVFAQYDRETQPNLVNYCFNNYNYVSQSLFSVKKFIERIKQHHLLVLSKAPFSRTARDLHPQGLPCTECPERTLARPLLFKDEYDEKDACMNRSCYDAKLKLHIQQQRAEIVKEKFEVKTTEPKKFTEKLKKVPLVSADSYLTDREKPKEDFVYKYNVAEIKKGNDCEFSEEGVFFNGDRVGQKYRFCRDKKCKKHNPYDTSSVSSDPEKDREARMIRKEELFDIRVGEPVRKRVLRQAMKHEKVFKGISIEVKWLTALLKRLWDLQYSRDTKTSQVIAEMINAENWNLAGKEVTAYLDGAKPRRFINELSTEKQIQLLFLLLNSYKCAMYYDSYVTQKEIREIADEYEVDYRLLDAKERLALAPMKQKDVFRDYLQAVEAGDEHAKIPRIWSTKWKPKD